MSHTTLGILREHYREMDTKDLMEFGRKKIAIATKANAVATQMALDTRSAIEKSDMANAEAGLILDILIERDFR
jgi:hypothetical protein